VTPYRTICAVLAVSALMVAMFSITAGAKSKMRIEKQPFGKTEEGQPVDLYTLKNNKGMEVAITNYGGTVVSIKVPDREGKIGDIVLGYDTIPEYENGTSYFGGTIGRYANRIAHGTFKLDGVTYHIPKNDGDNSLHGGIKGFNKRIWTAKDVSTSAGQALEITYLSKDGEEGFPGNLSAKVVFTLPANENELRIEYTATTDKDTVVNLTNHSYWNLSGPGSGDILHDEMTIYASRFTPIDQTLIPTGELREVKGTPFDFLKATAIGARINQDNEQLKFGKGYDHNWVLDRKGPGMFLAARAYDPHSGRVLEVLTTQPGIQFYTGNFLNGAKGKGGVAYNYRSAFCLETQHFPDSPNHPKFPTTELKPGQHYDQVTVFKFLTEKK
jgi:aldose 1-epimerase